VCVCACMCVYVYVCVRVHVRAGVCVCAYWPFTQALPLSATAVGPKAPPAAVRVCVCPQPVSVHRLLEQTP